MLTAAESGPPSRDRPAASVMDAPGEALSPRDFDAFRQLVYQAAGIHLSPAKVPMLSNRLRRRLRQLGLATYGDYYRHLTQAGPTSDEFYRFLEVVTTNETYFLRNRPLWDSLERHLLPGLLQRCRGTEPLVFWSAACSSGEEPYTLAVVLHRCRGLLAGRRVRILASDISQAQLSRARAACYDAYAVSRLSDEERRRHFMHQAGQYRLKEEYRRAVEFFFHNLQGPLARGPIDCVILRNVLMYFDEPMRQLALQNVCASLRPGGLLIVGDVDPLRSRFDWMEQLGVRCLRTWAYEKID